MEEKTNLEMKELTIDDILLYVKRYFVKIMTRGLISVVVIIILCLLVWLFQPYKVHYSMEVENALRKIGDTEANKEVYVYPNDRAFNSLDIIAPVVIRTVYVRLKLEDKISYDEFASLFYVDNSSIKAALLDAEYAEKLSKKNLNVVYLGRLEREYNLKKSQITNNIFSINMKHHSALSRNDSIQILGAIPETWFQVYSKTEAAILPNVELNMWKKDFTNGMKTQESNLIVLEKARFYCQLLNKCCRSLQTMMDGKNITLNSGEYLEDIKRKLEHILQFQIGFYSQYVVTSPKLFTQSDQLYLERSLLTTNQKLTEVDENIKYSIQALEVAHGGSVLKNASAASQAKNGQTSVNVEFNDSIFAQITNLVRNDVTNELRSAIAKKLIQHGDAKALVTAEMEYMTSLMRARQKKTAPVKELYSAAEFRKKLINMQKDLLDTAEKVQQFREKITKEYLSSRTFYKPAGDCIKVRKIGAIPIKKLALGLLGICVLFNLGMCCWDFKFKP